MSRIITEPQRFTHAEWNVSNKLKYKSAEDERKLSERLIDESKRLDSETRERTNRSQDDVNKKLEQRINDIKYWKSEVDDKLEGIVKETDYLIQFINRVEKAIESVAEPLHIAQQCLTNRERRRGIDLVHDDVQRNLIKEVETFQGVLELLQRTLEQANEQLRLNRKAKYILEKDIRDKLSANLIDDNCRHMANNSHNIHLNSDKVKIVANSVTPEDWEGYSDDNIKMAERERQNSVNMRSVIDGVLQQVANDMSKQIDETHVSFDRRIQETRDAKNKLESHLDYVKQQIRDIEENIAKLEIAIGDKEAPLKLAQTRLEERSKRPNVELCRDAPQYRLISEVSELERSIAELNARLADSNKSLQGLLRNQVELETEIEIKSNSLFIDESDCMGMRQSIQVTAY